MQPPNSDDFKEFLKLLIENNVEYLIIGGYAVAFYSRPRFTDDLDIWIKRTPDNFDKIIKSLKEFGFSDLNSIDKDEFFNKPKVYRIGKAPIRLELLNEIDGVKFEDAFKNRVSGKYADMENVNYISFDDLIKNKKASNRTKDKHDLDFLNTYKKNK